ncbi:hypothetical protein BTN50_0959 [Candidatus Enterovibrio altilux]|uniref:Uncharacterized protein n=1 Tax=Candidatus Enterovibrio altilux TaxID=1927128 RepID=A0A291B8Y7_9GAMM|nr:hypothetical protein BTN50_0959 [Candidatus Enterovibrio luxaltus]
MSKPSKHDFIVNINIQLLQSFELVIDLDGHIIYAMMAPDTTKHSPIRINVALGS